MNHTITVQVTNLCLPAGNEKWCPVAGKVNSFGFPYHFDLMLKDFGSLLDGTPWDNPVVWFKQVECGKYADHLKDCKNND